ncbi:MAG TPA: hypothetical protein VFL84_08215 [Gammaproteobacteria bacterium]|nr:hypothetical protein [Gammaproteobacteria bacterium]
MKVREVLDTWPPDKWTADDGHGRAPTDDAGKLKLLWFSVPDAEGWFSLTATDSSGASWSTYCRTSDDVWRALEHALHAALKQPLELVGNVEVEPVPRPRLE